MVINRWLPRYGPSYGDAFYLGWTAIIPNIPGIFTWPGAITNLSCFSLKLQATGVLSSSYTNIGGSLIGELFFNFGFAGGAIFAVAFGVFIGLISGKCTYFLSSDNYHGFIRVIALMFATIYWVRDYFGGEIRVMVWGPLICYLIIHIIGGYKSRGNRGGIENTAIS
ncbi:hypothetical protein SDC9_148951 [bioreactor metagenome]|uniref:Uncharacterized protein n=1 Tax=bioreactor metagenome TaxID=1076179 RepID=A0A645EKA3_9ZZZZ